MVASGLIAAEVLTPPGPTYNGTLDSSSRSSKRQRNGSGGSDEVWYVVQIPTIERTYDVVDFT